MLSVSVFEVIPITNYKLPIMYITEKTHSSSKLCNINTLPRTRWVRMAGQVLPIPDLIQLSDITNSALAGKDSQEHSGN
jgi:hypothetical protein